MVRTVPTLYRRPSGLNFMGDYLPLSNFVTVTAVPVLSTLVLAALVVGLTTFGSRRRTRSIPV